jgi:hypothetical protein
MIKSPDGLNKLDGILLNIDRAHSIVNSWRWPYPDTLEEFWEQLREIPFLGGFMAYEIVSDLRWTPVLDCAKDINTWTNAGPGCTRGIGRVYAGDAKKWDRNDKGHQAFMLEVMRSILTLSKEKEFWPQEWLPWEMREVEHWACEYDKWCRAIYGDKLKRGYKGSE